MSNIAIDTETGKSYTIEKWLKECANRKIGRCPICDENVYLKADKAPDRTTHFSHYPESKCPTIPRNRKPYGELKPSEIDQEAGDIIRRQVYDNLYQIYLKCKQLVGSVSPTEFKAMLEIANLDNIWNYKGLTLKYIPYILVCCEQMFKKDRYRDEDFYFVFEPNIQQLSELWIYSERVKQKMWKIYPKKNGFFEEFDIIDGIEPTWFTKLKENYKNELKI